MTLPDHHHIPPMAHPLYLGLPPWDTISGGNLYNRDWVRALPPDFAGQFVNLAVPDAMAHAALRDHSRWIVVDTLWHHHFMQLAPHRPKAMLMVHLLAEMTGDPSFGDAKAWPWLTAYEHFCVTGRYAYNYLRACGVSPLRLTLIEPRLWPRDEGRPRDEGWHDAPSSSSSRQNGALWVTVANLSPVKGIRPALEALRQALEQSPSPRRFIWQIYGQHDHDPDYARSCRDLVASDPGLRRHVRWIDNRSPQQAAEGLGWAQLYLSTATMETYGMAVAEAAALGKPVVAIACGNIPYLLGGGRGKHRLAQNHDQLIAAALSHDLEPAAPMELGHSRTSFRHAVHSFCQKVLR